MDKRLSGFHRFMWNCKVRKDSKEGYWCSKLNKKCFIDNCVDYPPLFPLENVFSKKVIHTQSNDRTGLSKNELKAFELYQKGYSFSRISDKLNVSKSTAFLYVKKSKGYKGVTLSNDKGVILVDKTYKSLEDKKVIYKGVRLHNDSVSFLIKPVDLSMEKDCVKLRYAKYVLLKTDKEHIQVFSKKLVVNFKESINGDSERDVFLRAEERIKCFLLNFKMDKVEFLNDSYQLVSRHYAILNSGLAERFVKEKKRIIILNKDDKGVRGRIDFSHRVPELDWENTLVNLNDSERWTALLKDSVENPIDLFSVTKQKTDLLLNDFLETKKTLLAYQEQIKEHLSAIKELKDTNKEMSLTLRAIQDSLKR